MENYIENKGKVFFLYLGVVVVVLTLVGQGCAGQKEVPEKAVEEKAPVIEEKAVMTSSEVRELMKKEVVTEDAMMKKVDGKMMGEMMARVEYQFEGTLDDVTDGGGSSGLARASFSDGKYVLLASFADLPEPDGTDFYEGWIVRKSPFDFISTGRVTKVGGIYTNVYQSEADYTDHDFYVLTLEPNDGNDAPDKHIVEGTMVRK